MGNLFDQYDEIPRGAYDVILTDPPWLYAGSKTKDQAAGKHYECLPNSEIAKLDPVPLLTSTGVLFMWTTGPMLARALDLIRGWGLHYRGIAFVWCKTTQAGKVISGQGARPSIVKPTTELVLAAAKRATGRPRKLASEAIGQVVLAPRGAHSQKPEEVQARIEALFPPCARLEMFARRSRSGWDAFGNEVDVRVEHHAPASLDT